MGLAVPVIRWIIRDTIYADENIERFSLRQIMMHVYVYIHVIMIINSVKNLSRQLI